MKKKEGGKVDGKPVYIKDIVAGRRFLVIHLDLADSDLDMEEAELAVFLRR
jgi:hypothetical protein